jgi:hypothetical protein
VFTALNTNGISDASRRCKQRPSKFLIETRFFQQNRNIGFLLQSFKLFVAESLAGERVLGEIQSSSRAEVAFGFAFHGFSSL